MTYYIPIQSLNLGHYLGAGIIAPAMYFDNKSEDIQDKFKNYILLSKYKFTNETNCSIEIILDEGEEIPVKLNEDFYLFNMPLPISRIKKIYFKDKIQLETTEFNINNGTAFFLKEIQDISNDISIDVSKVKSLSIKSNEEDWSPYLKKYDQYLGGLSLMKIGKNDFQNFPTHYFRTLGNINSYFTKTLETQNIEIENPFKSAFVDEDNKSREFYNTILSDVNANVVKKYAEKDRLSLDIKNGVIQIKNIDPSTQAYYIAVLETYGIGKRKNIDSLINEIISGEMPEKRKESLALIFGLNKGYKAFRNQYNILNNFIDVKFKLDNRLDYYTIESVYQNVFNFKEYTSSFEYIDKLFENVTKTKLNIDLSSFETYKILDETIIWKEKEFTPVMKLLNTILGKISAWFPSFLEVKKNEIQQIFLKDFQNIEDEINLNLNSIISEKDKEIQLLKADVRSLELEYVSQLEIYKTKVDKLEKEILEINSSLISAKSKLETFAENVDNKEVLKNEKPDLGIEQNNNVIINCKEDLKENIESKPIPELIEPTLPFADDEIELKNNIKRRESELRKLRISALEALSAEINLKIDSPKRKTKEVIIKEILKKEFNS